MSTTFDLNSLGLGSGSYVITIAAKGINWRDSARSTEIAYAVQGHSVEANEYGETVIINNYTTEANASGTTVII